MEITNNYIAIMVDGLRKKVSILTEIIELCNKEKDLLIAQPFIAEEFDVNMINKAELVDKLSALDEGFTSVYNRVKEELEVNKHLYKNEISEMKLLISQITELSVRIRSQESRNKELANRQFQKIKTDVKHAKLSGQTASNYYKSMSLVDTEPQFIDKKK